MLDFIRNNRRFLQFVLLVLVLPAFGFFGIQGYSSFGDGDNLVSIGRQSISQAELDATFRTELEKIKQQQGERYDAKLMDTPEARQKVLDGLVSQKVAILEAQRSNLSGSDTKVLDIIKTIPEVYSDGKFNEEAYKRFISSQGYPNPDAFEARLRTNMGVEALAKAIQTPRLPNALIEQLVRSQEQTISVQEVLFKPEAYAAAIKPDANALNKFYTDHAQQFAVPEQAKIEYVVLDAAAMAARLTVSEFDLKAYYDSNKARFTTPEERQASHILIKVDAKASTQEVAGAKAKIDDLAAQLKKDPNQFAALAKAQSQDTGTAEQGGDLGYFGREGMVKPFSEAAFSLKDNEISAPIKTEFGWHLIHLTGIKAAQTQGYESLKTTLESELKTAQATKEFAKQLEEFTKLVYDHDNSFKVVADKFKLDIQTLDKMSRAAMMQPANPNRPKQFNAKLADALFSAESIQNKKNTDAIELTKTQFISARLIDYVPAKTQSFEQVKSAVETLLRQELALKQAKTEGETKLKALQIKGSATSASVDGLSPVKEVSRQKPNGMSQVAFASIARASVGTLPAWTGVVLPTGEYALYKITALGAVPAIDDAKREEAKKALTRAYGEPLLQGLLSTLRVRHHVKQLKTLVATDHATSPAPAMTP